MKHCLLNPIYIDRKVAKMKFSFGIMFVIILLLPVILTLFAWLFSKVPGHASVMHDWADNPFWGYYSSYVNPNVKTTGGSFLKKIFEMLVSVFGIVFVNCILVSLIVSWMEGRGRRWKEGDLHYDRVRSPMMGLKNYAVIIGGNEMVPNLAGKLLEGYKEFGESNGDQAYIERKFDYVLIMTNRKVPALRKKLKSILGAAEENIVIYHGERDSVEDLKRLQLEKAEVVYVIGEELDSDQNGSHHDVMNMQCVKQIADLLNKNEKYMNSVKDKSRSKLLCRTMYEYQSSFAAFQITDVNQEISNALNFRPFNYYETWAQKVLVCPELELKSDKIYYLPLEGEKPITADSDDYVHLIIVGMSRMGVALGIEAAHLAHYPNFFRGGKPGPRTRITFIDKAARTGMQFFQGYKRELFAVSRWRYFDAEGEDFIFYRESERLDYEVDIETPWKYPRIDKKSYSPYKDDITQKYSLGEALVDVDWEFIQGELENPRIQRYISDATKKKNVRLTIALCFPRDNASFAGSLYLPDDVYDMNSNVVQVLAYQPHGDAMCKSFKNKLEMSGTNSASQDIRFNQFGKLKAFGMIESCYDVQIQSLSEFIADQLWKQYDETYKERIGGRNDLRKKYQGIQPLKAGKSLAAKQWSNTYAALHLWTKLRSVKWNGKGKISQNDLKDLAILEHTRWNLEQLLLGFAPLLPEQQKDMKDMRVSEEKKKPADGSDGKVLSEKEKAALCKWLDDWKPFDTKKEVLKANMRHLDICSFDVLEVVDKEAVKYDVDMTAILPQIYRVISQATR